MALIYNQGMNFKLFKTGLILTSLCALYVSNAALAKEIKVERFFLGEGGGAYNYKLSTGQSKPFKNLLHRYSSQAKGNSDLKLTHARLKLSDKVYHRIVFDITISYLDDNDVEQIAKSQIAAYYHEVNSQIQHYFLFEPYWHATPQLVQSIQQLENVTSQYPVVSALNHGSKQYHVYKKSNGNLAPDFYVTLTTEQGMKSIFVEAKVPENDFKVLLNRETDLLKLWAS